MKPVGLICPERCGNHPDTALKGSDRTLRFPRSGRKNVEEGAPDKLSTHISIILMS